MSTIYIGERQSGKTTMLIEMSEKTGATIVVATYPMAKYIQLLAAKMGKKIPVPITVTNYIRLLASGGLGRFEKYLVDELQMMLQQMNIEAATADNRCVKVLPDPRKGENMNLDELRKAMSSEATEENKKLKAENQRLREQFHNLNNDYAADMKYLTADCEALSNRCFALTKGVTCVFCELNSFKCKHAMNFDQKVKAAKNMMKEINDAED